VEEELDIPFLALHISSTGKPLEMVALIDSGANCNIATMALYKQSGKVLVEDKVIQVIKTAEKGSVMQSIGTIDMGGMIGIMMVVPVAGQNLLSVSQMTKRRAKIVMVGGQCIIKHTGTHRELIIQADRYTDMFHADIEDVLALGTSKDMGDDYIPLCNKRMIVAATRLERLQLPQTKLSRLEIKKQVGKVFRLHKTMGHLHFRALASGVRDGLILGTGLTFQQIMLVSQHIDCVACALAKWPRPDAGVGSGIKQLRPFEHMSMDKIGPYKPVSIGGHTGAIIATCCSTTYMIGYVNNRTS
jgi:hypothetical protein